MRTRSPLRLAAWSAALVALVAILAPLPSYARKSTHAFASPGLRGTGGASMQSLMTPARIARVAVVPGTRGAEAWAVGLSGSKQYATDAPGGQLVFLHYRRAHGWVIDGPPVDAASKIINPTLYSFDVGPRGEGWAVGESGVILHRAPGGRWVQTDQSGVLTTETLRSVDVVHSGGALAGFAVGDAGTILRLANGRWVDESTATIINDLVGVGAFSATLAYAVGGDESVAIYRRLSNGWSLRTTHRMFDGPHPATTDQGAIVRSARASAVAATPDGGAWIGGEINILDPGAPFGNEVTGSETRPFALHITNDGFVSYCPDLYSAASLPVEAAQVCHEPFPTAGFDITSFSVLPNGEVFAGGLGLFHFRNGAWVREPDSIGYLVSVSMASATDGWMATSGNTFGGGGAAYSSALTIGHWTTRPEPARMARWPQPQSEPLESVALAPKGGKRALAVGQSGALVEFNEYGGWDATRRQTDRALHAVAWPTMEQAWAVGGRGAILHRTNEKWAEDPASGNLTIKSLFGVAFNSSEVGFAVGQSGTILRHDGVRWRFDPASGKLTARTLYAVAATTTGFIAVGEEGTILEHTGGAWRKGQNVTSLITRPRVRTPNLYSVVSLADGGVLIGGAQGTLIHRLPGDQLSHFGTPMDGQHSILSLAAAGTGKDLRVFASVSPDESKYGGDRFGTAQAYVMVNQGGTWEDLQLAYRRTIYDSNDPAAPADTILGIAIDRDGTKGWAVGGVPSGLPDREGHVYLTPTSGIYRIDLQGDPRPDESLVPAATGEGITFAVFGETTCGKGLCSIAVGTGNRADVVSERIREEISFMAKQPGGPKFALFAGNMRARGQPEELGEFKRFLRDFPIPVYGALGDQDLFSTVTVDAGIDDPTGATGGPPNNDYFRVGLGDMLKPWGDGPTPAGIRPVETIGTAGEARTHYAFDVMQNAKPALRVIVVDSSRKTLTTNDQNPNRAEGQRAWLTDPANGILAQTSAADIPMVLLMNQPTLNPYTATSATNELTNWSDKTEAETFHNAIDTSNVAGVFAGGFSGMTSYRPPSTNVPFFVSGGGGRPAELTKQPVSGFYSGWLLVTVGAPRPGTNEAPIRVKSIPVLDSIALDQFDGTKVNAGNILRFGAVLRFPDGGFTDPEQSKTLIMNLPQPPRCPFGGPGLDNGGCTAQTMLSPDYEFSTSDSSRAEFVKFDPGKQGPYREGGKIVTDSRSGYLCTYKAGPATVYVTVGLRRTAVPIYVDGGFGPCVDKPVPPEPPKVLNRVIVRDPVPEPEKRGFIFRPDVNAGNQTILAPIPAPVVAPAPPGAPGVGRKEEHEASHETEGHGEQGKHQFVAVQRDDQSPAAQAWPLAGGVAFLALMAGAATFARREQLRPKEASRRA